MVRGVGALVSAHRGACPSWHTQLRRQHLKGTFISSFKYRYLAINSNVRLEALLDTAHMYQMVVNTRATLLGGIGVPSVGVSYIYTLPKSSFLLANWCKLASEWMRLAEEGCKSAPAASQSFGLCVVCFWWGTAFSRGQGWLRQRTWHRTCPPSFSSHCLISGPQRSLLVKLWFCFWIYFLVPWAVLGHLNSILSAIR